MFEKRTVFVIGAGASWHYGYPTGEQLVREVQHCTERLRTYCKQRIAYAVDPGRAPDLINKMQPYNSKSPWTSWNKTIEACEDLINRLANTEPLVIDYFLGWNQHLSVLGRAMIAFALLERESHGAGKKNYNRFLIGDRNVPEDFIDYGAFNDNWARFIVHKLLLKCRESKDLYNNDVGFITFNYDCSLERNLGDALHATAFLEQGDVDSFLHPVRPRRFVHMYGALEPTVVDKDKFALLGTSNTLAQVAEVDDILNACWKAGENLRVIDPNTKDGPECAEAIQMLDRAETIYFLGFGFDANNISRLDFPHRKRAATKIYFTNYLNSMTVNKRAGTTFKMPEFRTHANEQFSGNGSAIGEKSIRDCYEALALDFGALED